MGTATISIKVYGVELRIFSVSVFDLRRVDAFFDDLLDRLSNVGIIVKKADRDIILIAWTARTNPARNHPLPNFYDMVVA